MPSGINYKNKYLELRSKYMNDLDTAFRLGFEQGQQQAEQQQAVEAEANAQQMQLQQQQIAAGGMGGEGGEGGEAKPGQPKAPGAEGGAPGEGGAPQPPGQDMNARGSELDQHIGKLEGMLGSGKVEQPEVQKSIHEVLNMMKSEKQLIEMKKSENAIKGISAALHKPSFKLNATAKHNLDGNAQKTLSLQHEIVNDVFKSWELEEKQANNDIKSVLKNILSENKPKE